MRAGARDVANIDAMRGDLKSGTDPGRPLPVSPRSPCRPLTLSGVVGWTTLPPVMLLARTYLPAVAAVGVATGVALTAASATAQATALATGLGIAGLAALAWLVRAGHRRADRLEAAASRLEAVLDVTPCAWFGWDGNGTRFASPRFAELLAQGPVERAHDVARALEAADSGLFVTALDRLVRNGEGFDVTASSRDGRIFHIAGRCREGGGQRFVLWLEDVSRPAHDVERLRAERDDARARLAEARAALDGLPIPVWIRGCDLALSWCNRSFARAVDADPETALGGDRDLLPGGDGRRLAARARDTGTAQARAATVVIGSERRRLEVTEAPLPLPGGGILPVGFALDRTEAEDLRAELQRHLTAHAEVLERLGSAIAIFGPDTRLTFFNQAFVRLWGLEETWLRTEPTHGELLEELRSTRKLPEYADFQSYKRERLARYTTLIDPTEDLMHLPEGTTLRELAAPHPMGGLILVMEDVTNTLALESSYNTLIAVQQETLDNLAEGIAVFGGDGRLKLSNPAFARIWDLRDEDLQGEPHITDVFERMRPYFLDGDESADSAEPDRGGWDALKEEMIGATLERVVRSGRLERADGSVVEFSTLPLPDGAVLNSYLDVTDSARLEQALRASNTALEAADELKGEFIANVSHHLRTPLNGIVGFAEVLANQYFGPLNPRQLEYVKGVGAAGERMLDLIDDIVDLTSVGPRANGLERAPVNVADLVESVAVLTRDWARREGLRLEVGVPTDPAIVEGDGRRLKQALFNLVVAAIRTPPPEGRIRLAADRGSDGVVLTVGDPTLPTPDPELPARPASSTGLGLGLALVRNVIELHGGRLLIDGAPGHGNRVRCLLPLVG